MRLCGASLPPKDADMDVLLKQDDNFRSCTYCFKTLVESCVSPYQVVLCVMGGNLDQKEWNYDFVFGLLCRNCQTRRVMDLFVIEEADYGTIAAFITEYAFKEHISISDFLPEEGGGVRALLLALLESYVYRFDVVNKYAMDVIHHLQTGEHGIRSCAHCLKTGLPLKKLRLCPDCSAVTFCVGSCYQMAQRYHFELCRVIKQNMLFDTRNCCYISRGKEATCLPL